MSRERINKLFEKMHFKEPLNWQSADYTYELSIKIEISQHEILMQQTFGQVKELIKQRLIAARDELVNKITDDLDLLDRQ